MKKSSAILSATLGLALLGLGTIVACKQAQGERCQVNDDCEDGLQCILATDPPQCGDQDTSNPIDAEAPPDAPYDAPSDAASDATPPG